MQHLAIYPGTFDPPTLGHLDVAERAARLFDKIIIAVGVNSSKSPLLTLDERLKALTDATAHLPNISVASFSGLLVKYTKDMGARSIVRGLRATQDFEYEFQIALANRRLDPEIDTVFLMTKWEHSYLSSSIVREVAVLGGNYTEMVPPEVVPIMELAIQRRQSQA